MTRKGLCKVSKFKQSEITLEVADLTQKKIYLENHLKMVIN